MVSWNNTHLCRSSRLYITCGIFAVRAFGKKHALVQRGLDFGVERLHYLDELTYSPVVGQKLAKARIMKLILGHFGCRHRVQRASNKQNFRQPLFLAFIGPLDTGKTSLAREIGGLLAESKATASLFLAYGDESDTSWSETQREISGFMHRMSNTPEKVGVLVLDQFSSGYSCWRRTGDLMHRIMRENSPVAYNNIVCIRTERREMCASFYPSIYEIENEDARTDALITDPNLRYTASNAQPIFPKEAVVPFVPLTRAECIAKTKLLIERDANVVGLSFAVKHRFAEYIADKYGFVNEELTSMVLQAEVDYWHVLTAN